MADPRDAELATLRAQLAEMTAERESWRNKAINAVYALCDDCLHKANARPAVDHAEGLRTQVATLTAERDAARATAVIPADMGIAVSTTLANYEHACRAAINAEHGYPSPSVVALLRDGATWARQGVEEGLQLRAQRDALTAQRDKARAEVERMRAVVEAAKAAKASVHTIANGVASGDADAFVALGYALLTLTTPRAEGTPKK